jgi:hypothetical protein
LREYIVKGFAMADELLKQRGGGNYFEELPARIRSIRSSEKVFWRKVLGVPMAEHESRSKTRTEAELDPESSLVCDTRPSAIILWGGTVYVLPTYLELSP